VSTVLLGVLNIFFGCGKRNSEIDRFGEEKD
jgi:hypothetical protein